MGLKRKQTFYYMATKTVGKLFSAQITAAAIYLLMVSLTVILFSNEQGKVLKVFEWIPLITGILVGLRLVNIHMHRLGEEHHTTGVINRQPKPPIYGLIVGLWGISPILLFWVLMIFGFLFQYSIAGLQVWVGYFLYPWSPYFDLVRRFVSAESFWGVLFYIPPMLPIPLLSYFAFRNGTESKPLLYRFWDRSAGHSRLREAENREN